MRAGLSQTFCPQGGRPDEVPRIEFDQSREVKLERIRTTVDLTPEDHVPRFDAQTVRGLESAFAYAMRPPRFEHGLAEPVTLPGRCDQLVAQLAAEPEPADHRAPTSHQRGSEAEVAQGANEVQSDQVAENGAARGTLEGDDCMLARAIHGRAPALRAVADPRGIAAPSSEEPEPVGLEAPSRRVDEHAAVLAQQEGIDNTPGLDASEVAGL